MRRTASARLELDVAGPAELVLSVAAARLGGPEIEESLVVTHDGSPVEVREVDDRHGTRLHLCEVGAGLVVVDHRVEVAGRVGPPELEEIDLVRYRRPSRYCESDTLAPTARAEFRGLVGRELLSAVSSWVGSQLAYVPGASAPTDGAVQTLLDRQGVCRDYAHLVIALLRALDVPARLVSVYAPGLSPMDFHAVAEAWVDGAWHVVDATALAPRQTLVRIATGRDASDTAFLSSYGAFVGLRSMTVSAVADELPRDDVTAFVSLG